VNLASNSTRASVFSTSLNGTALGSITIQAGSSSASFYYGDTKAGSPTISASSSGLSSASQTETITVANAQLTFSGSCTSNTKKGWTYTYTVSRTTADQFGNPVPTTSTITVNLSGTNGSWASPSVTIAAGTTVSGSDDWTNTPAMGAPVTLTGTTGSGYSAANCSYTTTH
jgi:hypothetical protein